MCCFIACSTAMGVMYIDAAPAAARGKLYIMGGEPITGCKSTPFRVYEPVVNTWFEAPSPTANQNLPNSVLISNLAEGMLLSMGGYFKDEWRDNFDNFAPTTDRVAMLDINAGR